MNKIIRKKDYLDFILINYHHTIKLNLVNLLISVQIKTIWVILKFIKINIFENKLIIIWSTNNDKFIHSIGYEMFFEIKKIDIFFLKILFLDWNNISFGRI